MRKSAFLAFVIVLVAHGPAVAQSLIDIEGRMWFVDVNGETKVDSGPLEATDVDFDDDLGLDSDEVPEVRLSIFTGANSRLRFAYNPIRINGDNTLTRSIVFDGQTYSASTRVRTDLDVDYLRLGWIWQPLVIPGVLKFGPVFELKGALIDASIETRGSSPDQRESESFPFGLPTLGVALNVTPHRIVELFGEVSGMTAGDYGHFIDAEVGIRLIPVRFFTILAGYRYLDLRAEVDNDFGKLKLSGPFVGASFRF